MPLKSEHIDAALVHLRQVDSIMNDLIEKAGPFTLKLDRNRFGMLVRSILSQQISTSAARAIRLRLDQLLLPDKLSAEAISNVTDEQLRAYTSCCAPDVQLAWLTCRVPEEIPNTAAGFAL